MVSHHKAIFLLIPRSLLREVFIEFTEENDQWREVAERQLESGLSTDIPGMREKYLHFTGAGLLVLCGVGHAIMEVHASPDGRLTPEQKDLVRQLGHWTGLAVRVCGKATSSGHKVM